MMSNRPEAADAFQRALDERESAEPELGRLLQLVDVLEQLNADEAAPRLRLRARILRRLRDRL